MRVPRLATITLALFGLIGAAHGSTQPESAESANYEFVNGLWFDDEAFVQRTLFSEAGVLTATPPVRVDRVIDLAGVYVVPPFGAHNHNVDFPSIDARIRAYRRLLRASTIFPNRKIGHLEEGYEASFLVLAGNPLEDFSNVRRIEMRVKQGHLLEEVRR